MKAWEIIGYAFDGAVYHPHCLSNPKECTCPKNKRDDNGLCMENCHGYGPNPIFANEETEETDYCDKCAEPLMD
jgi:hypothetical protein